MGIRFGSKIKKKQPDSAIITKKEPEKSLSFGFHRPKGIQTAFPKARLGGT